MYRIMLVDDEPNILSALKRVLATIPVDTLDGEKPEIETFTSTDEALIRASSIPVDLVISDYRMPGMNGIEFLSRVIAYQPNIARLILSGNADLDAVVEAINKLQIFRFITKPWHDFELKSSISQALAARALAVENQQLADVVRVQNDRLKRHEAELQRLETESPGITKLKRSADGGILIEDDDY
ncbi:MAG: response regulator [Rudaea sp.]|nr:response regulator [Rudaea sp.]